MKILDELTFKELLKNIKQLNVHTESVFFYCRYLEYHLDVYALKEDNYIISEMNTYDEFYINNSQKEILQDMVYRFSLPTEYGITDCYDTLGLSERDFI